MTEPLVLPVIRIEPERDGDAWIVITPNGHPAMTPPLTMVYSGQVCLGFILNRGKDGFEALTANERSLGHFPTQREAATAVMRGQR